MTINNLRVVNSPLVRERSRVRFSLAAPSSRQCQKDAKRRNRDDDNRT